MVADTLGSVQGTPAAKKHPDDERVGTGKRDALHTLRPNTSPSPLSASYSYAMHQQKGRYQKSRLVNRPASPFSAQMPRPSSAMSNESPLGPLPKKSNTMPGIMSRGSRSPKKGHRPDTPLITKEDIESIASKSTESKSLPLRAWASVPDIHSDGHGKRRSIPHLRTQFAKDTLYSGRESSPELDEFGMPILDQGLPMEDSTASMQTPDPLMRGSTAFPGIPRRGTGGEVPEVSPGSSTGGRRRRSPKDKKSPEEIMEEEMAALGRELEEDQQAKVLLSTEYERYKASQEGLNDVRNDLDQRRAELQRLKKELQVLTADTPVDRPMYNAKKELMDRPVHDRLVQLERAVHRQEHLRDEAMIYTHTLNTVTQRMLQEFKAENRKVEERRSELRLHEEDQRQLWKVQVDSQNEARDAEFKLQMHADALKRQQAIQQAQRTKMQEEHKRNLKDKKYEEERRRQEAKISQEAAANYYWEKYGSKQQRNMHSMLKMRLDDIGAKGKESSMNHIAEMEKKYRELLMVAGVERVEDVISKYMEVQRTKDALEEKGQVVEVRIREAETERARVVQELEMLSFRKHDRVNVNKVVDEYDRKLVTLQAHSHEVEEKFRRTMVGTANIAVALHYFATRVLTALPPTDHQRLYPAHFDADSYLHEARENESIEHLVENDMSLMAQITENLMAVTPGSKENVWDLVEPVHVHGSEGRVVLTTAAPQLDKMHGEISAAKLIKAATGHLPGEHEGASPGSRSQAKLWRRTARPSGDQGIDTSDPLEVRRSALRLTAVQRLLLQKRVLGGDPEDEDHSGALSPGSAWMKDLYVNNCRLMPLSPHGKDERIIGDQDLGLKDAKENLRNGGAIVPRKGEKEEEEETNVMSRDEVKVSGSRVMGRVLKRNMKMADEKNEPVVLPAEQIDALSQLPNFDPTKFEVSREGRHAGGVRRGK